MRTTNEQLTEVIRLVDELIAWADADAELSLDAHANDQAASDRRRHKALVKAKLILVGCFK